MGVITYWYISCQIQNKIHHYGIMNFLFPLTVCSIFRVTGFYILVITCILCYAFLTCLEMNIALSFSFSLLLFLQILFYFKRTIQLIWFFWQEQQYIFTQSCLILSNVEYTIFFRNLFLFFTVHVQYSLYCRQWLHDTQVQCFTTDLYCLVHDYLFIIIKAYAK